MSNVPENRKLRGLSSSGVLRKAPESSGWATDPDRDSHGKLIRPRRSKVDKAKENCVLSRKLETEQRARMVERTFVLIPSTRNFVENFTGGGEARATWVRTAIGNEIASDARLKGKSRVGYRFEFDGIAELSRGRPGTHGEGRSKKLPIRLPKEMMDTLALIAKRDKVSVSVIVQKAIDVEHSRIRNMMNSTLSALSKGTVFAPSYVHVI